MSGEGAALGCAQSPTSLVLASAALTASLALQVYELVQHLLVQLRVYALSTLRRPTSDLQPTDLLLTRDSDRESGPLLRHRLGNGKPRLYITRR